MHGFSCFHCGDLGGCLCCGGVGGREGDARGTPGLGKYAVQASPHSDNYNRALHLQIRVRGRPYRHLWDSNPCRETPSAQQADALATRPKCLLQNHRHNKFGDHCSVFAPAHIHAYVHTSAHNTQYLNKCARTHNIMARERLLRQHYKLKSSIIVSLSADRVHMPRRGAPPAGLEPAIFRLEVRHLVN